MRKFTFSFKSLLVAFLLLGGANSAWGAPIEVVGNTEKTSGNTTHSNTSIILKKGETKVITFNNYGSTGESWYNWRIEANEGSTEKFEVRADSYDNTTKAASNVTSYKVATSRGGDKGWLDWNTFKTDMQNASCVAQITYGTDNKLSLRTTSECSTGRIYYVDHDVTGLTGADVNIVFYVDHSYLEIMSISSPIEVLGAIDNTTGYEASIRGAINKEYTISRGETMKFNFNNYGKGANNWDNWSLRITNTDASFDRGLAGGNHINLESGESSLDAYAGITQKWFIDGVDNYTTFMAAYKTQMMNANVTMTVEYSSEGAFSVTAESTMGGHEYRYVFTRNDAFTGNVNIKLGVDCAWLEILAEGKVVSETLNTNMSGYKTFYNAISNYKVDANTTIYKAAEPSAGKVVLTDVGGNKIIKAGQPVILHTSEASIVITPTATESTGDFADNALQVAAGTENNKYVLGYTEANGFGFYYYTAPLPAGYIYLDGAAPGVKMLNVIVDGTATGVEAPDVTEAEEEEVLYNTAGVRVGKDYKGIVINQKGEKRLQK
jgi:hypothetical protein